MNKLVRRLQSRLFEPGTPLVYLAFGVTCVAAMVLRALLYPIITGDYTIFLSQWYDFIQTHGGFAALKYSFSNYNPPYLYLLAIATYLPIPKLIAIKSISVAFDLVLALFTYLILRLKYQRSLIPLIGSLVILFVPTIVINSAAWGQCDAMYTAFCLGSLYFLLKQRQGWACVFFGLAIAFKLQAIFFLPVLLLFALKGTLRWRYLLLIPAVFVALLFPAYVVGRDAGSLLTVYAQQMDSGGVGGGTRPFQAGQISPNSGMRQPVDGTTQSPSASRNQPFPGANQGNRGAGGRMGGRGMFSSLTYNAPTIYQWFTGTALAQNKWVGIGLAAFAVALAGAILLLRKVQVTATVMMNVALVCVLTIPFFLPHMHERYFYLADVISIIYAFYFPRSFSIPILMQLASLLSYAPYLLNTDIVSLWYVAFIILAIVLVAWVRFMSSIGRKDVVASLFNRKLISSWNQ